MEGDYKFVEDILRKKMLLFAEKEEFELTKHYRDVLGILEKLVRKQTIPFKQDLNIDVFTMVSNGLYSVVNCFSVRGGKFLGGDYGIYRKLGKCYRAVPDCRA